LRAKDSNQLHERRKQLLRRCHSRLRPQAGCILKKKLFREIEQEKKYVTSGKLQAQVRGKGQVPLRPLKSHPKKTLPGKMLPKRTPKSEQLKTRSKTSKKTRPPLTH